MPELKGLWFAERPVSSKGNGAFGRKLLSDGAIQGCELTTSGTIAKIAPGFLILAGRLSFVETEQEFNFAGQSQPYARIIGKVDLNQPSSEAECLQATFDVQYASSESGFSELTVEDINMNGSIYESVIAVFQLSSGTIQSVVKSNFVSELNGVTSKLLWENASPASAFAEQTITVDLNYDFIGIVFNGENNYILPQLYILEPDPSMYPTTGQYFNAVIDLYSSSGPTKIVYNERAIKPTSTGVHFYGGFSVQQNFVIIANNFAMRPFKIFGIKGVK